MKAAHAPSLVGEIVELGPRVRVRHSDGWWVDIGGLSSTTVKALAELKGNRTINGLCAGLPVAERQVFLKVCEQLTSLGLLRDPSPPAGRIAVLGSGPLAQALIDRVADQMEAIATDAYGAWVSAHTRRLPRCAQFKALSHWSELNAEDVDLVIVASGTVEPDRAMLDHLHRRALPHLIIQAHHGSAAVGPLVDGHTGSCRRCHDLLLTDEDPDWPHVLRTLSRVTANPDPAALDWAVSIATPRILWFIDTRASDLFSTTLQMSATHPGVERAQWPLHQDCADQIVVSHELESTQLGVAA